METSKYQNTMIYKIVCNDLNIKELYIGSTINFKSRKSQHKLSCNNENEPSYTDRKYVFIRENGGWKNWSMIEIENYSCNNINEATSRERYWYELLNANLNMRLPQRSEDEKKNYNNEYLISHKIELKEKRKIYRQSKEVLEKEINRMKGYYADNKKAINLKRKEKITCECGSTFRSSDKAQHIKTIKHQNFIKNNI